MIVGIYEDHNVYPSFNYPNEPLSEINYGTPTKIGIFKSGIVTVTDIVSTNCICARKTWYEWNFPVLIKKNTNYALNRGSLVHKCLFNDSKFKEYSLFDYNKKLNIVWNGKIDAYYYDTKTVYEFKTKDEENIKYPPSINEIMQGKLYVHLLEESLLPVEKLKIIHFSFKTTNTYEYDIVDKNRLNEANKLERYTEDQIFELLNNVDIHRKDLSGSFNDKSGWACSYCSYYRYCSIGLKMMERNYWGYKAKPTGKKPLLAPSVKCSLKGEPEDTIITIDELFSQPITEDYLKVMNNKLLSEYGGMKRIFKEEEIVKEV